MIKKMKIFLVFSVIFFSLVGAIGCSNEKVKINFKVGEYSSIVEIDKGTIITEDIIPFIQNENIKLYYDEKFLNEYNNEEIYKNIDIYLQLIDEDDINMIDKVCEAYFDRFIKPKREDAIIEDVKLFEYLGTYNGVFVGVLLDKKDCVFPEKECKIIVEDIVFYYSYGYNIYAYDGCVFMDLLTAYNNSKIVYEDLLNIYKLHIKTDNSDGIKNDEQILLKIKQDYYNEFVSEIQNKNVSDIIVNYYIGEYNGYFILMLSYEGEPFFDVIKTINFGECSITYPNSNILRAWKEGTFYDLKELYELGELSKNDIEKIIEQYNNLYENDK